MGIADSRYFGFFSGYPDTFDAPDRADVAIREEGGFAVIADAIIDNRRELSSGDMSPANRSDHEHDAALIARLWAKHGNRAPAVLVGDFAFAVLDRRAGKLFLLRDHIGAKSLYWTRHGNEICFGSFLEDVVAASGQRPPIDESSVAEFLANASLSPTSGTFYTGVRAVPAGCIVEFDAEGTRTSRWWDPAPQVSVHLPRASDYVDAMRSLVDRAVEDRIAGVRRVGAHVSGGIDSTGIGIIAARKLRMRGEALAGAYSWSPDISELYPALGQHDERQRVAAAAGNVPIRFGAADEHNFIAFIERPMELEGVADLADEIPMLELAARDGIDVMLSGWGGDEAFSAHGHGYIAEMMLAFQPKPLARFARSQLRTLKRVKPLAALLWQHGLYPLLPDPLYRRLSPYPDMAPTMSFMSEPLKQRYRREIDARREQIRFRPHVAENIKRHLLYGHIAMRMETWAAWAKPFGFQYRYPLTDRRIVEFVMAIPPKALLMNDRPRGLALAALADALPPNIIKVDPANERLRETTRYRAWVLIAERTKRGELLQFDCPWLDMTKLRARAVAPMQQNTGESIIAFAELCTALRAWHMYRRSLES